MMFGDSLLILFPILYDIFKLFQPILIPIDDM